MRYTYLKRLIDIIIGLIGLIILVPFTIIIKVLFLLCRDKGKIMYNQKRIGKDGKPFNIHKYRTMVVNADEMLDELLKDEKYKEEWDLNQKIEDDPRITTVGKFLRKTSLDELPQLLNVLKGEMSLVGPRPLVEGELEAHGGTELYWKAKPGITGWWASHGRSNVDYKKRLEMEYYYVRNQSLRLDMICILKTIKSVLTWQGAK